MPVAVAVAIIGFIYWKKLKLLIFYMWKKTLVLMIIGL